MTINIISLLKFKNMCTITCAITRAEWKKLKCLWFKFWNVSNLFPFLDFLGATLLEIAISGLNCNLVIAPIWNFYLLQEKKTCGTAHQDVCKYTTSSKSGNMVAKIIFIFPQKRIIKINIFKVFNLLTLA